MPIKIGDSDINDFKLGDSQVNKLYLGDNQVWAKVTLAFGARDTSKDFNVSENNPSGAWGDGTTIWVGDEDDGDTSSDNINTTPGYYGEDFTATRRRRYRGYGGPIKNKRFLNGVVENGVVTEGPFLNDPHGIWSNGTTIWIADNETNYLRAYVFSTSARDGDKDIPLASGNDSPRDIWSNGTTIWVSNRSIPNIKLFAYTLSTGARDSSKDISLGSGNLNPYGIASNGTVMWVVDTSADKVFAYNLSTRARDTSKEFDCHSDNSSPTDIWVQGTTAYVADVQDDKFYAYNIAS